MDHTALIALAALTANLKQSRIHKVTAQVMSNGTHLGGILNNVIGVKFGKATKPEEWVCTVSLKLVAYPKGTTEDNAEQTTPIFLVDTEIKGIYSWQQTPPEKVLRDPILAHALGRPLYQQVVSECKAATAKMGFYGIQIAADLPRADEGEALSLPVDTSRTLKSDLASSPKSKVGSPRKTVLKDHASPKTK